MGSVSLKLLAARRRHGRALSCLYPPMLLSLLSTNLLVFFPPPPRHDPATGISSASSNLSAHVTAITREIGGASSSGSRLPGGLPRELLLFPTQHALPLGRDARTGLPHMLASAAPPLVPLLRAPRPTTGLRHGPRSPPLGGPSTRRP